jgi:hypothetical protein
MDPVALDPSPAPVLARVHPSGSVGAAQTGPVEVTRIAAVASDAAGRRGATFIAGAAPAAALAHARPFAAGRKTVWDRGDAHPATSAVDMAGGAQTRGATLFALAVLVRDPSRDRARARVLVHIHRTRGIAGAGAALGRKAGDDEA